MKEIIITEEQKRDFAHSLLKKMKNLFHGVFHSDTPKQGEELKGYLLSHTKSEEEKEALEEILDEISTFYQKREEYAESGKELDVWYNEEIEKIVRRLKPEATLSEIDSVKEAIAKQIDIDIEETAMTLEKLDKMVNEELGKEEVL